MSDEPIDSLKECLESRPWTVAFYSFRGGVGRTTLLLSIAEIVAENSRIGILDFDLEAPGIDAFPNYAPEDEHQLGLIEYIADYRNGLIVDDQNNELHSGPTAPDIRKYVYLKKIGGCEFVIMRAGRYDSNYRKELAKLDLTHFYRFEHGESFFEELRAGLKQEFGCDILLVDSRTGFTEIGGVCLGHLADAAVLAFQPTQLHMRGLPQVAEAIRQREARQLRSIPRIYVATKTPKSYSDAYLGDAVALSKELVEKCEPDATRIDAYDHEPDNDDHKGADVHGFFVNSREPALVFAPYLDRHPSKTSPVNPDSIVGASVANSPIGYGILYRFIEVSKEFVLELDSDYREKAKAIKTISEWPVSHLENQLEKPDLGPMILDWFQKEEISLFPAEHQLALIRYRDAREKSRSKEPESSPKKQS